jgi:hypothetical protein
MFDCSLNARFLPAVRYCQLSVSTLPNPQPVCKKLLNPSIL